jgi:hypothetical protein
MNRFFRNLGTMARSVSAHAAALAVLAGAVLGAGTSAAVTDEIDPVLEMGYNPGGVFIQRGEYVMNVGNVHVNITNWGAIGSYPGSGTTMSDAPSCQWPPGSSDEYLYSGGLWVGAVVLGERLVSTGNPGSEIYPSNDIESTIYEAIGGKLIRPEGNIEASGRRRPEPNPNDDDDYDEFGDPRIDEEILNGKDDDDDGLIDEDFAQIGNQMMVLTQYDNTLLAQENRPDHTPLNLEIVQSSYQWENDEVDDFVGFEYQIKNIGVTALERVYIGFYADSDIGNRSTEGAASDDLAGSFRGLVRASDGGFVPVEVGYMFDSPEETAPLPGFFGILFLGHDVDPSGQRAPSRIGLRTFQAFSGSQTFDQGGDPTNDDERYQLLSAAEEDWDNNAPRSRLGDFRFLVSGGPFLRLEPDDVLSFQIGMVVGDGLGGNLQPSPTQGTYPQVPPPVPGNIPNPGRGSLLSNCAEAVLTWYGIWVDDVRSALLPGGVFNPGQLGRETMLCVEDFGEDVFSTFYPDYGDPSCIDGQWLLGQPTVTEEDRFDYEGSECAMFNMDNCFECARQLGRYCRADVSELTGQGREIELGLWKCNQEDGPFDGCTGINGLDTQIHWLVGMAPPPPGMRIWASDSRVHVFWNDTPEHTPDIRLNEIDFESYKLWRADNWDRPFGSSLENGPASSLWQLVAEYDVINSYVSIREDEVDTIPLGRNTGFETIRYTPKVLSDPEYAGLAEAMQEVVDNYPVSEGEELDPDARPPIYDQNGNLKPEFTVLAPWQTEDAVLDTFWAVTPREGYKRAMSYYEYVDYDIHNGFIYFYSVTSSDHELAVSDTSSTITGSGLVGNPGSSFTNGQPGTAAQTAEDRERFGTNIYVFPNPATRKTLEEYQQMFPTGDDPTGVRVTFTNLPMARNTIKIYTASGDLVQTIEHDGTGGSGHVSWNLMSRNAQEIVSGIYLYSVQSDDDRFDDFIGRFVVVR